MKRKQSSFNSKTSTGQNLIRCHAEKQLPPEKTCNVLQTAWNGVEPAKKTFRIFQKPQPKYLNSIFPKWGNNNLAHNSGSRGNETGLEKKKMPKSNLTKPLGFP